MFSDNHGTMTRSRTVIFSVLLLFVGVAMPAAEPPAPVWYEQCRALWSGIPLTVRFTPPDQALADEAWNYLERVDAVFNDWRDDSELGRINAAGPGTYSVSTDLAEALADGAHLNLLTDRAFDITVGPLRRLWREAAKNNALPSDQALAEARAAVGPQGWSLAGQRLTVTKPGVKFDFGGVVKGMAVDRVVQRLVTAGRRAVLVQCGGETGCFGLSPRGRTHVLGIPHPDRPDDEHWCTIADPGTGLSGSTSGNYRQPVVIAGKPYYHIFDPRSGLPIDVHTLSISVAFPTNGRNGLADALTKVGAVLGHARLLPLVESLGGQALVLVREGERITEHATAGWSRLVHKSRQQLAAEQQP